MDRNISVVINLSNRLDNISEGKTKEKISGDIGNHYLPEHYLLGDRKGKDGTVVREVQRLDEEGRRNEMVRGKGGGVGSKSQKKEVKDGSDSVRKVRRRGAGRVKEIVLTLEEGT